MNIISENERSKENCHEEKHAHCCREERHSHCCHEERHHHSCCDRKRCHRKVRHCAPEPGKAILKCGCGSAGPLPILGTAGLIPSLPTPVASVSIDTSGMCNPTVLLTFTAQINTPAALLSNLTFRIVRCLDGCSQPVGGSYTFSNVIELVSSDSFTFQFCDSSQCSGCATYSVEITSATLLEIGTSVSATLTALAVENCC